MSDSIARRRARAENLLISQRNYRRARDRALTKLANRYKKQYLALLKQEQADDKAQGKVWNSITDNNSSVGKRSGSPQKSRKRSFKYKGKRK